MRRVPLAYVLVGVLSLLAAGAAVLGVFQAPTGNDLTVHNDAEATLQASPVVGHYTASYLGTDVVRFDFVAPDRAIVVAKGPTGTERRALTGRAATGMLEPVNALLSISGFRTDDGIYVSTLPLSDVVPADERGVITGRYRTTVHVAGDFVVGVLLQIAATEKGQHLSERVDYHLTRVGSWEGS